MYVVGVITFAIVMQLLVVFIFCQHIEVTVTHTVLSSKQEMINAVDVKSELDESEEDDYDSSTTKATSTQTKAKPKEPNVLETVEIAEKW